MNRQMNRYEAACVIGLLWAGAFVLNTALLGETGFLIVTLSLVFFVGVMVVGYLALRNA